MSHAVSSVAGGAILPYAARRAAVSVDDRPAGVIVLAGSPLFGALERLAAEARLVFFAGLPGTGKSLLIHQLAHLAHARGRRIHLLQWDVARPVFEASSAGQAYPQRNGVTHGMIRLAVGRWARDAIARWHDWHARPVAPMIGGSSPASPPAIGTPAALLIGETPLVGHRFMDLARIARDPAEPILAAEWTRFVIPVPSRSLRAHVEVERERRTRAPLHPREREDAPPAVLRDLFRQLVSVAREMGLPEAATTHAADTAYDPALYQGVYERLLVHRHAEAWALDTRLPAGGVSPYDVRVPAVDLVPTGDEAALAIREAEARYPDPAALQREIDGWFRA